MEMFSSSTVFSLINVVSCEGEFVLSIDITNDIMTVPEII